MSKELYFTLRFLSQTRNYPRWLIDMVSPGIQGRVLEIGSGRGDLGSAYLDAGISDLTLSDYSETMVNVIKARFKNEKRVKAQRLDILARGQVEALGRGRFDTVVSINVFEHIEDDATALSNVFELLRPGGRLLMIVPALTWLYGSVDELVGHYRRYSRGMLCGNLQKAGFQVEKLFYMNMFGVFPWFLSGRILRQREFPVRGAVALDKIVPFLRFFERLSPPLLGQSLVAWAKK